MHWLRTTLCLAAVLGGGAGIGRVETGRVEIAVVDSEGQPLACRIHLYNNAGKPQRAKNLPFFRDHFVCPGNVKLELKAGTYRFEVERGPEYAQHAGTFELAENDAKTISVALGRIADLAALGWYSGDLHVHRAVEEMPLLMRAEDLHVAPVIAWWNDRNLCTGRDLPKDPLVRLDGDRFYHLMAGEDEREGGALMYFQRTRPLAIAGSSREHPSPMQFVAEARRQNDVWIDVSLAGRDNVPAIEIIANGAVERLVPVGGPSKTGSLGTLTFDKSGWFLVRAVTDLANTFRFASTSLLKALSRSRRMGRSVRTLPGTQRFVLP